MANLNCKRHTNNFQKFTRNKQIEPNEQYMVQNEREFSQTIVSYYCIILHIVTFLTTHWVQDPNSLLTKN